MIEFLGVSKKYDHGVTALDNINLKIEKGEFVFLVGPSGSGKTTFLKLMIKEEDATSGKILIDSTENITFALRVIEASEREIKNQLKSVLEMVGLSGKENFYPNQLSGGEQQRIALARALATKPPIIIADEPTGNLDPATADEIFKTLLEINSRGTTVIVVTHAKDVVNKISKRVIALDHGKIVKDAQRGGY